MNKFITISAIALLGGAVAWAVMPKGGSQFAGGIPSSPDLRLPELNFKTPSEPGFRNAASPRTGESAGQASYDRPHNSRVVAPSSTVWDDSVDCTDRIPSSYQRFYDNRLVACGMGSSGETHPGRQRVGAMLSAKLDAYRNLLVAAGSLDVTGESTVRGLADADDRITARIDGVLKGAELVPGLGGYNAMDGTATVYMSVPIYGKDGLAPNLLPLFGNQSGGLSALAPYAPSSQPLFQGQAADGLIVVVPEHAGFKPAFMNMILTDRGQVLYDPRNVPAQELRPIYRSTVEEARQELADGGHAHISRNPMEVRAAKVVDGTNLQVGVAEASNIFAANQLAGFLEKGLVAFVMQPPGQN